MCVRNINIVIFDFKLELSVALTFFCVYVMSKGFITLYFHI